MCPNDPLNDIDKDYICGDVDSCQFDKENDVDDDLICGDVDSCPLDSENDADSDSICGNVDSCPYDAANDADSDGVCATMTCMCASPEFEVPYFMITRLKVSRAYMLKREAGVYQFCALWQHVSLRAWERVVARATRMLKRFCLFRTQ